MLRVRQDVKDRVLRDGYKVVLALFMRFVDNDKNTTVALFLLALNVPLEVVIHLLLFCH